MTGRLRLDGIAASVARGALRLLPSRSRERYAAELADVYAGMLGDAARTGGKSHFVARRCLGEPN